MAESTMLANRDAFINAKKLATRDIATPIGLVRIREPMATEMDEFDREAPLFSVRLVHAFVVDAGGQRVFQNGDLNRLARLGTSIIEPVALAILELAGLTKQGLERVEKNSPPTPSGVFGSV